MFNIILAGCEKRGELGVGYKNKLPWKIPEEMGVFREITISSNIIMGRKTFEDCGILQKRFNIVLSKDKEFKDFINKKYSSLNLIVVENLEKALDLCKNSFYEKTFVIGGGEIYKQTFHLCNRLYLSKIKKDYDCDVFVKINFDSFEKIGEKDYKEFSFEVYKRKPLEEEQYLNLVRKILKEGLKKEDRTGKGTISICGEQMVFDISEKFPLLTTKFLPFRLIFEELMWFLRGQTDVRILEEKNIKIWSPWKNEKGFANKIYGYNWRNFGGKIDQIKESINLIKNNPNSRRIIVCAWNPLELNEIALPACHTLFQFYVREGFLDCLLYQRSGDLALGIPFNIASYSLLTYILADHCNLKPGKFIHNIGDSHIYNNHIEGLLTQIQREPFSFPTLTFKKKENFEDYVFEDFSLENYKFHKKINFELSV